MSLRSWESHHCSTQGTRFGQRCQGPGLGLLLLAVGHQPKAVPETDESVREGPLGHGCIGALIILSQVSSHLWVGFAGQRPLVLVANKEPYILARVRLSGQLLIPLNMLDRAALKGLSPKSKISGMMSVKCCVMLPLTASILRSDLIAVAPYYVSNVRAAVLEFESPGPDRCGSCLFLVGMQTCHCALGYIRGKKLASV